MSSMTLRRATLAYLVLVLLLGGASAAGFAANTLLAVLGAALLGWALWQGSEIGPDKSLRRFGIAVLVLAAVQFLPLPPGLWRHLPGRETIAAGFDLLRVPQPWLNLSLSPWHSLESLAWWIPALALFAAMRARGAPGSRDVVMTIALVAGASVLLGVMQRVAGSGYIYEITNFGEGPGFFANSNHQGSFLLCTFALLGGQLAADYHASRRFDWRAGANFVRFVLLGLLLLGVLISGSLACLTLLVPVALALALIVRPALRVSPGVVGLVAVAMLGGYLAFLLYGPVSNDLTKTGVVAGISRHDFLITGARILRDFAPLGSGLGTFQELYPSYENVAQIGTTFVNHAHDDLLEILIETGVFGLVAVIAFLAWYVPRSVMLWRGARAHSLALGASVAIGVELVHSLVDYPLRTAAMSSVMAIACVLLVRAAETVAQGRGHHRHDKQPVDRSLIRI